MSVAIFSGQAGTGRNILQIMQDVASKLGIAIPQAVFGSTERTVVELQEAAIEAKDKILEAHNWQRLLRLETHTGNGQIEEYAEPSDYLRMPKDSEIWSTRWQHPLLHISPEDWLHLEVREFDTIVGSWTRFGGNFVYKPALASGELARFWYMRNACVIDAEGLEKSTFTADSDTFVLNDRLLELVTIWTWRQQKGLDYAEDMATAEIAMSRLIGDDAGAKIITQRKKRNRNTKIAYPWSIVP